jgi:hypothetical protein
MGRGNVASGAHTAAWNASAMPAGMYLARLQAEGRVLQKKILLLK